MGYKNESLAALARQLETIDDPRDNRGKLHRLIDIFILTIYGSLWGHTDFTNMADDLKYHEAFFTNLLGLPHGIPSHDTFSAVFSVVSPAEFLECFIGWIAEIMHTKGKQVALDGKAVRAACDKIHNGRVPYLVNAYVLEAGLCIGQIRIDDKTNEIKGIPEMIEWLDLEGAVVTIDAIGCQKEIVELLIEKGADFVLSVKDNQKILHDDILLELETKIIEKQAEDERIKRSRGKGLRIETPINDHFDVYEEYERGHSRIERRTYYTLNSNACVNGAIWPYVASVGMVVRERLVIQRDSLGEILKGTPTVEREVYIMSKEMKVGEFASYVRGHWRIENSLHWVLDDFFREDRCTSRIGHATENLAMMRKIVYDLMKLDENVKNKSMKGKQVYYRNNPEAIRKLIFGEIPSRY